MQNSGLRGDQVTQVRGYADQMPRKKDEPLDASNRRISVIVQNLEQKPEEPEKTDGTPKPETSTPPQSPPKKD
jgi:chemotaxis protein MotB